MSLHMIREFPDTVELQSASVTVIEAAPASIVISFRASRIYVPYPMFDTCTSLLQAIKKNRN